jgi:hypothetical protein
VPARGRAGTAHAGWAATMTLPATSRKWSERLDASARSAQTAARG